MRLYTVRYIQHNSNANPLSVGEIVEVFTDEKKAYMTLLINQLQDTIENGAYKKRPDCEFRKHIFDKGYCNKCKVKEEYDRMICHYMSEHHIAQIANDTSLTDMEKCNIFANCETEIFEDGSVYTFHYMYISEA